MQIFPYTNIFEAALVVLLGCVYKGLMVNSVHCHNLKFSVPHLALKKGAFVASLAAVHSFVLQ